MERLAGARSSSRWESYDPGLLIIANPQDLDQVENLITQDAMSQLRGLDWNRHFAVIAFQGLQPYLLPEPFGIEVQEIDIRENVVTVHSRNLKPPGEVIQRAVQVSPYHLVKVRKEGNWGREFDFELRLDGRSSTSVSHFIP
jgi:hypothetical protein